MGRLYRGLPKRRAEFSISQFSAAWEARVVAPASRARAAHAARAAPPEGRRGLSPPPSEAVHRGARAP